MTHSGRECISASSLAVNAYFIRATEADGVMFITSQPGTVPEANALE